MCEDRSSPSLLKSIIIAGYIVGVSMVVWLQVVGIVRDTVIHHILHALPIFLLLLLRRTRIVQLTSAVLGIHWVVMLACVTPMIYNSLIKGLLFSADRPDYTWLAPIMAGLSGVWAVLHICIIKSTKKGLLGLLTGGLLFAIPLAMLHPIFNAAFEIPGNRTVQGDYFWAIVFALEMAILIIILWLLTARFAGIKRSEINRRVVIFQVVYWLFFLLCMIAGLLPAFNP